jgi:hypothetical protein
MANRFWVGGAGTWDASDASHWAATSGAAPSGAAPTSADNVIFDNLSGGGTVTVVGNLTISQMVCGSHTGTLDFASSNMTFNSTVSISAAGVHTIKWGSGTHTFNGSLNLTQTGTNLTLDVGTARLILKGGGGLMPGLIAHILRIPAIGSGSFVQINSSSGIITTEVNFLETDNANGAVVFALNSVTLNVKNNFYLAGRPNAPTYIRGATGTGIMTVDAGKSGFIEWAFIYGMTFGSGITLRNCYDGAGNANFIPPPQATAIGAL